MDFKSESRTEFMRAVRKEKSYEMNKCLTLVHLTSAFRIQSLGSEESKARNSGLLTNRLLRCLGIRSRLV
jgi:hypothetical protein